MENTQVIIEQKAGVIGINFEEMKQYLNQRLEEYRGAVFTDDSIKPAKVCVACLRKEQTAIKGRITEVKKEYMLPFDEFKSKVDELVRLYDEPINFIDAQVKNYEERRKAEKREEISRIYETLAADIEEYIPLNKIYNPKWENASFKKKDITDEITGIAESTRQAIAIITGMNSEVCEKALLMYKQDLSLNNAIAYINNYERQKAEILLKEKERQRREDEDRIRMEEREKIEAEQRAAAELDRIKRTAEEEKAAAVNQAMEISAQEVIESLTPEFTGETSFYEYRITLNVDAKEKLEMYMDSVGIEWELI